jgi:hypothetical protein
MPTLLAGTLEFVHIEQVSALDKLYCILSLWGASCCVILLFILRYI